MEQALCPACHKTNQKNAKFCQACGNSLWVRDRYMLQTILEQQSNCVTYKVLDRCRCGNPDCGGWIDEAESSECSTCHLSPYPLLPCELHRYVIPPLPNQIELRKYTSWFYEEMLDAWFGATHPQWNIDCFVNGQQIIIASATDKGKVYEHNEDALLFNLTRRYFNSQPSDIAVLAIADGMGGHQDGQLASRTAVTGLLQTLSSLLSEPLINPTEKGLSKPQLKESFRQAILQANQAVFDQHEASGSDLGATITAVWLLRGLAIVANVGDSRTYLYRTGSLQQITVDHSKVYRLMETQQISRDEIYTHPERNQIYRNLGDKAVVDVDIFAIELEPNDLLLLCCDGLWEMARDTGIEQILAEENDLSIACQRLVEQANEAGGHDNISVILARIEAL